MIARILAVGDAFSAMTTTRPYRKALDLREALRRLEDAAGSQLDETLVTRVRRGNRDGGRRAPARRRRRVPDAPGVDAARRVIAARRAWIAGPILAVLLVCAIPQFVLAARLWTLVGTPLTSSVGVSTTVTLNVAEHRRERRGRRDRLRPNRRADVVLNLLRLDRLHQRPNSRTWLAGFDLVDQRRRPSHLPESVRTATSWLGYQPAIGRSSA